MKIINAELFLKNEFSNFYNKIFIKEPNQIEKREFGIGNFHEKIYKRHLSFTNYKELNAFLREETPLYISFSGSYYKNPSAVPMQNKNRIAADLFYEIDADDLDTECKQQHDIWYCEKCSASGKGKPQKCIECGANVKYQQWVCKECLNAAKKELYRLIKILEKEFDIFEDYLINFSGHKGYHLHIRAEKIKSLSKEARNELMDYITLHNLTPENFVYKDKGLRFNDSSTIAKKIKKEIYNIIEKNNAELLSLTTHSPYSKMQKLLENKKELLENLQNNFLPKIPRAKLFWENLIQYAINKVKIYIDRQTSIDINKILRLPNSLHGGTGLQAKILSLDELKNFDPLKDAIVFDNTEIKVAIKKTPKFYFNGSHYKFDNEIAYIEKNLAIYLIAKHLAKPLVK